MLIGRPPLFLKVAIEKILNGKNGKNFSKKEEEKRVWENFKDDLILIEFEDLKFDYLFGISDFWPVLNGFEQFQPVLDVSARVSVSAEVLGFGRVSVSSFGLLDSAFTLKRFRSHV